VSNEIALKYGTTGLTVKAEIKHPLDRTLTWNGTAFAAYSTISLADWRAALVTCTEQALSAPGSEATATYVGDRPAGVPLPCSVFFFSGATPLPGDDPIGYQDLGATELVDVGNAVADGSNTATAFKTNLAGADEKIYLGRVLVMSGTREPRRIDGFNAGTKFVTLSAALDAAPTAGDAFVIVGYIEI
jgi:hypothetical protein